MTIPMWVVNSIIILIGIMIIYAWSFSSTKMELESETLIDLSEYDDFQEPLNKLVLFYTYLLLS